MKIRRETEADYDAVAKVTAAAFGKQDEARLVEAIRGSEEYVPELTLVAEENGRIVGHVMYSRPRRSGYRRRTPSGPNEDFMAVPLTTYDPALRGRVRFAPAFA